MIVNYNSIKVIIIPHRVEIGLWPAVPWISQRRSRRCLSATGGIPDPSLPFPSELDSHHHWSLPLNDFYLQLHGVVKLCFKFWYYRGGKPWLSRTWEVSGATLSSIIPAGILTNMELCLGRYLELSFHNIEKNIDLSWTLLATQW